MGSQGLDIATVALIMLVIAVVIKTFLIQPFWIPSESMLPTIEVNDRVMVNKLAYQWGEPQRGDVVVFRDPREGELEESVPEAVIRSVLEAVGIRTRGHDDLIKRVIGLPGETVEVRDNRVVVDGEPLDEPYLPEVFMPDEPPITLGAEEVFVMGDNRDQSLDSRFWGFVREEKIRGKAFRIYWSWSGQGQWKEWVRWGRFGKAIQ